MYVGTKSSDPTYATAFAEYTGIPSAIGGGAGAVGVNVANQGVQVQGGASIFSKAKYGFRLAWAYETVIGTALIAGALTILDPQHKWEGGLDEWVNYGADLNRTKEFNTPYGNNPMDIPFGGTLEWQK